MSMNDLQNATIQSPAKLALQLLLLDNSDVFLSDAQSQYRTYSSLALLKKKRQTYHKSESHMVMRSLQLMFSFPNIQLQLPIVYSLRANKTERRIAT